MNSSYSLKLLKIFRKLPSPLLFIFLMLLALVYRLFNLKKYLFISGWHKKIDRGLSAQENLREATFDANFQSITLKLNTDLTEDIYPLA